MAQQKKRGRAKLSEAELAARKAALKAETKRDRFLRLAPPRVQRILDSIRALGSLARGKSEYTPEDVLKMASAIEGALKKHFSPFQTAGGEAEKDSFKF